MTQARTHISTMQSQDLQCLHRMLCTRCVTANAKQHPSSTVSETRQGVNQSREMQTGQCCFFLHTCIWLGRGRKGWGKDFHSMGSWFLLWL